MLFYSHLFSLSTLLSIGENTYQKQGKLRYNKHMFIFLLIISVGMFMALIIVAGIIPFRTAISKFELERRKITGDAEAILIMRREALLDGILSLQRIAISLLLV